jgi:hypothetical protein
MRFAALSGVFVFLCGCAGSGAGGGAVGAGIPANGVRGHNTGDMFTYAVTGTYAQAPSILNKPTSGTQTEAYQADTYNGQPALQGTVTTALTLSTGQTTLTDSKQMSSVGATIGQTDAGVMQAVTAGGFTEPQTLSATTNFSGTETLANGTTVTLQYAVTGAVNITTSAGTFPCWTIARTITYSDGFTANDTIEFAPLLGAPVQEVIRHTYSNGFSDNITTSLTSYMFGGT